MRREELERLLDKILSLKSVKENIREMRGMRNFYEHYTDFDFEADALHTFLLEGEYREVFKAVPEIFSLIKDAVKDEVDWILSDYKSFCEHINHKGEFELTAYVDKQLEELHDELYEILKKRYT